MATVYVSIADRGIPYRGTERSEALLLSVVPNGWPAHVQARSLQSILAAIRLVHSSGESI
jgi:hypothetical protein